MDMHADVIYAVNVGHGREAQPAVRGILNILMRTIDTFISQSLFNDLKRAEDNTAVALHHIHITDFSDLSFNDFNHIDKMFAAGKVPTDRSLEAPAPFVVGPPTREALPRALLGAREYIPPFQR